MTSSGSSTKSGRLSFKGMGAQVAANMLPDGMKSLAPSGSAVVGQEMKPDPVALGQPALSLLDVIPTVAHAIPEFSYMRQTVRDQPGRRGRRGRREAHLGLHRHQGREQPGGHRAPVRGGEISRSMRGCPTASSSQSGSAILGEVPVQHRPADPEVLGDVPAGVAIRLHPFRIGEPPERKEEGYAHIGSTSTRIASRYDTRCSRCGDTILTWTTVGTVAVP